jgi:hypothetical protein
MLDDMRGTMLAVVLRQLAHHSTSMRVMMSISRMSLEQTDRIAMGNKIQHADRGGAEPPSLGT